MLRMIQVGLGPWGLNWARDVLAGFAGIRVAARVDTDPASRAAAAEALGEPPALYHPTLAAALSAVEADAVLVTVPLAAHGAVVREALAAGRHVLVEKPFTETAAEAGVLADLADSAGRVLMVSQNYRFFPAPLAAAEIVADRRYGALRDVDVTFRHNAGDIDYRYYHLAQPLLSDMAIHHFDLMRMVLGGEPESVSCRSWNTDGSGFDGPPAAEAALSFDGGVAVRYDGSWISEDTPTAWAGSWTMRFDTAEVWWTSRGSEGERFARDRLVVRGDGADAGSPVLPPPPHLDRTGCLDAFARAVAGGRRPDHFSSARDNIGSVAMVEAAVRSAAAGRPVALTEVLGGIA